MDFAFTDEQELLAASLTEFFEKEYPEEKVKTWDENHEFPVEANKKFAELGFSSIGVPEELGGTPADMVTMRLVKNIAYRYSMCGVSYSPLTVRNMLEFGNDKQREVILTGMVNGTIRGALGITEPGAGSDAAGIQTTYKKVDGGYILNGQKIYNTFASAADYDTIVARDADWDGDPHQAMSEFIVWTNSPGVAINDLPKVGQWLNPTCETYLDNVFVPDEWLFGKEHEGWKQLMRNFQGERLLTAAMYLGQAETAFEDACSYANTRIQFGQTIGSFQLIQEKICYMRIKIENMRNLLYKTAWRYDQGMDVRTWCDMAKLYCTQSAFEIADDAMQILGGLGYTTEHRVQRIWRDTRVGRIGAGSDQIMIKSIGKQTLREYGDSYSGGTRGLG